MAVDLPPPLPPQQGDMQQVQQGEAVATVEFGEYHVHVFGRRLLSDAAMARAMAGADNLSNAVRALASASFAAGYPTAQLTYALNGNDLYVMTTVGGVSSVKGGGPVGDYFSDLVGTSPLTDSELEPRRALATVAADRLGVNAVPAFTADGSGGYVMDVQTIDGPDPTMVRVEFGNPGNRFVNRTFADLDIRTGTDSGDEFRAMSRAGMRGLSKALADGDYFEQNAGWNRVTPWGMFGAGGRYVDFSFRPGASTTDRLDGEIWVAEAYWLKPILADFHSRLTVQARFDRTGKTTDNATTSVKVQSELYNSAELGASYQYTADMFGFDWDFGAGLSVRKGLGEEKSSLTAANLDYLLYRPAAQVRFHLNDRYSILVDGAAQITSDTVPEQQQWVLGGPGSLSSYLPGVLVGDSGYLVRVVGDAGTFELPGGMAIMPKVFAEYGTDQFENLGGGKPALADAGVELGVRLLSWLDGSVTYAESIHEKDVSEAALDEADGNVFFRVQAKFQ